MKDGFAVASSVCRVSSRRVCLRTTSKSKINLGVGIKISIRFEGVSQSGSYVLSGLVTESGTVVGKQSSGNSRRGVIRGSSGSRHTIVIESS